MRQAGEGGSPDTLGKEGGDGAEVEEGWWDGPLSGCLGGLGLQHRGCGGDGLGRLGRAPKPFQDGPSIFTMEDNAEVLVQLHG